MIKSLTSKQNFHKLIPDVGGGWYMVKSAKVIRPLKISKLSKTLQEKQDEIQKIHEAYKWWNDWKFQLHWNKLEWVNPKTLIKR